MRVGAHGEWTEKRRTEERDGGEDETESAAEEQS